MVHFLYAIKPRIIIIEGVYYPISLFDLSHFIYKAHLSVVHCSRKYQEQIYIEKISWKYQPPQDKRLFMYFPLHCRLLIKTRES